MSELPRKEGAGGSRTGEKEQVERAEQAHKAQASSETVIFSNEKSLRGSKKGR